jgi:hypothetical protein
MGKAICVALVLGISSSAWAWHPDVEEVITKYDLDLEAIGQREDLSQKFDPAYKDAIDDLLDLRNRGVDDKDYDLVIDACRCLLILCPIAGGNQQILDLAIKAKEAEARKVQERGRPH